MSTAKKIAHNTAVQLIGKAVSTLLGFVAFLMMANYLGAEQFGWYGTTISVLGFAGILIDFGLIPVTAQMLSEPRFDKQKLMKNLFTLRLVTSVIFFGAIAGLIFLPQIPYPYIVKLAISFSSLSFIAVSINQVLTGYYQKALRMHIHAIGEVVGRIVLLFGLWLMVAGNSGFLAIMWLLVLSAFAYTAVLLYEPIKQKQIGFAFDKKIWKAIAIKSWPLAIAILFNVVYLKGDVLLLSLVRTQTEVGIYSAAYRIVDILAQLAMMVMGIMLPLMAHAWSRLQKEEFKQWYQQSFDLMLLVGLPVTIGTMLTAPQITRLFGGELAEAATPLVVLSIAVFGVYLGAIFGHAVVAINKQKTAMWIYGSNAILTLAGYLYFIPRFGMMGAAWMTVFSELYAGFFLYLLVKKSTGVALSISTAVKLFLATLLMAIPVMMLPDTSIFIIAPIAALVYAAGALLTRAVTIAGLKDVFWNR